MLDVHTSWYRIWPVFFCDRAMDEGDTDLKGEDGERGDTGERGWTTEVLENDVGLEGFGMFLGRGDESCFSSSLLAMDAETSTTV